MQRPIDDATGQIIDQGRSFAIGIYTGDDQPAEERDYVNVEDLIAVLREALACKRPRPPLQIIVKTWSHYKAGDPRPSWQRDDR
jgi:hypothetical protein